MTPAPGRILSPFGDEPVERRKDPTVKVEMMRQVVGMLLAGLVAYFATVYGLQERIRVLEVRLDYAQSQAQEARAEVRTLVGEVRELRDEVRELKIAARRRP